MFPRGELKGKVISNTSNRLNDYSPTTLPNTQHPGTADPIPRVANRERGDLPFVVAVVYYRVLYEKG